MGPNSYYGGGFGDGYLPPYQKKSFFKTKTGLLLIVLFVLMVLTVVVGVFSSLGGDKGDKFMTYAFVEYDATKSYELFSDEFKSENSIESWQAKIDFYKERYNGYVLQGKKEYTSQGKKNIDYTYNLGTTENYSDYNAWIVIVFSEDTQGEMKISSVSIDKIVK